MTQPRRGQSPSYLGITRPTFQKHLGYVWTTLVEDEEWILRRIGSVTLTNTSMIPSEGGLRLKDAVEAFLRFTDKPVIASQVAVTTGPSQACAAGLVGIGRGGAPSSLLSRHCRQPVPLDPTEDGVWIIPPFTPEPATRPGGEDTSGEGGDRGPSDDGGTGSGTTTGGSVGPGDTAGTTRTVQRLVVRGAVPVESWGELFRCFVGPAVRMNLKKLELGVRFEIVLPDDGTLNEDDSAIKAMKEAARQLGLMLDFGE